MSHNLDDLIIEEPEGDKTKSRGILSKIALVVIVLIVGVVISKLIMSDAGDPVETVKNRELEGIIDPNKTDPEIAKFTKDEEFTKNHPKKIAKIDDDLQPMNMGGLDDEKTEDMGLNDSDFNSDYGGNFGNSETKNEQSSPTIADIPKQQPSQNLHPMREATPEREQPVERTPPKRTTEHRVVRRAPTQSSGRYFIQVGAFSKKPSGKYLSSIRAHGFTPFVIKHGELYKVRVGAFATRADANAKLESVNRALHTKGLVIKGK